MEEGELELLRTPRLRSAIAAEPPDADPLRRSAALRAAGLSPVESALVLTQARLRQRARGKFGEHAERMLFTRAGLEQATRLTVAMRHAARFAGLGVPRVADLGCGIGGDALALALAGLRVLAVERDPVTAGIARENLAPFPGVTVRQGRAEDADPAGFDAAWLDPARRTAGHAGTRRVSPDDYSPGLGFAAALAAELPVGVKLGPAHPREHLPSDAEAQWVADGGETVELALWSGALARPGVRRAALVLHGGSAAELTGPGDAPDEPAGPLGAFLHEPSGAVLRAGLMGDLARRTATRPVGTGIGYLTGDAPIDSPFATTFGVEAVLPFDRARIRRELRARGVGRLEIKKRGVDVDPASFRAGLGLRGDGEATLVVTRTAERRVALICRRFGATG